MKIFRRLNYWYVLLVFLVIFNLREYWDQNKEMKTVPYSEFERLLDSGSIQDVTVSEKDVVALLKSDDKKKTKSYIESNRVPLDLVDRLKKSGVDYSMKIESPWSREIFSWIFTLILMFVLWRFLFSSSTGGLQNGMMSIGKSKAKIYVESNTKITFADVAGADEAKTELHELVEFLKEPKKFQKLGSRMPKGVLLVGPPGTGKTLIAKAVAGEAGVPFFSTNGAEFVEMFVGVGAARVRDLFEQAKLKAPCIIFIDELDALGKTRSSGNYGHGGNDEKEQTLNQLLAELDGFDSNTGIILLAATNRPEILDPALLRSGRFDRQVLVDRPDKVGRIAILKLHSKKTKLEPNLDIENIAALTPGLTGADLENLVNEASLIAVRHNADFVTEQDFTEAIERLTTGLEKRNRLINAFERNVVAVHEMGHALTSAALGTKDRIHKVSIVPRGIGALGYTIQRPTEERYLMTKEELQSKITVLLAGRSAEKIIFTHYSTGASDDLDKATDIAWSAVTKFGMIDKLGPVVFDSSRSSFLGDQAPNYRNRSYSDETAREIDLAIKSILEDASMRATSFLKENQELLVESAQLLLKNETLIESELTDIFSKIKK